MRLKYQLRGLGIGIVLTAALLMIFSDDGEASVKTDDTMVMASMQNEIIESSAESASVIAEENSISVVEEILQEEESSPETEKDSEEEAISRVEMEDESILETVEVSSEEFSVEEKLSSEEDETKELINAVTGVVKIKIVSGDDSGTVARKLQTAGLVDNASEFDAYLMQHGYDKKIAVGEKEISIDATWMEIAEKISSR